MLEKKENCLLLRKIISFTNWMDENGFSKALG